MGKRSDAKIAMIGDDNQEFDEGEGALPMMPRWSRCLHAVVL
jgi:hypothetical protein